MNNLDYFIVGIFLVTMIWMGYYFKKSKVADDYFLGGKKFGWFSLCLSAMATQLSIVSFVSAPAFVGLRQGGGMQWLTFEFGVPIAMMILIVIIGPALYRSGAVTAYSFLEKRFNTGTRQLISAIFIIARTFATAIIIYTVCLVLSTIIGITFLQTMLGLAVVTILYSLEGGMKAVVYSEVAQMVIKVLGIILITVIGLHYVGGWNSFITHLDKDRLQVIDFSRTGFDGKDFGAWPMLVGGIFLYTAYYGTDQTQVQRILSARNESTVKKLLLFNGLFRFPITLIYCFGGLILGTFASLNTEFASKIPENEPDLMVPVFIAEYLPHGVIGFLVVAMIAAGMSAFSSALNSLSATTMEDFIVRKWKLESLTYIRLSKTMALAWGLITIILAFYVGDIAPTVIEAINKISSMFNGPILAMFLMAILTKKITAIAANIGLISGVLFNLVLWLYFPDVFWFWWNAIGAIVTFMVAIAFTMLFQTKTSQVYAKENTNYSFFKKESFILITFFVLMLIFCFYLPEILS